MQQYQARSNGPNLYQVMQVDRTTPIAQIKKIYRTLSRNLHPDKNKSETAADDFRLVAHAFDVLTDREKRREYDRLGDTGVKALEHSVVDHKYILSHMIVYYLSSLVFAFLLNLSEKGEAFGIACAGLAAMFLLELGLKIHEWPLPGWFFPHSTPHEIISALHQIFSPFMHGIRCVLAVLQVDRKSTRETILESVSSATADLTVRMESTFYRAFDFLDSKIPQLDAIKDINEDNDGIIQQGNTEDGSDEILDDTSSFVSPLHVPAVSDSMENMLRFTVKMVEKNKAKESKIVEEVQDRLKKSLIARKASTKDNTGWLLLRNIGIYIAARFLFIRGE